MATWYDERVEARARLAQALRAKGEAFLREHFLNAAALEEIAALGKAAKQADREQQVQLAEAAQARAEGRDLAADVNAREGMLSALMPALVADLAATSPSEAGVLAKLSFARYRTRSSVVSTDPTSDAEREMMRRVERVERSDRRTRAEGLVALCVTLAERPAVVAALAARGLDATWLARLRADAEAVAARGSNNNVPAEATAREAAAVRAQKAKWRAERRLIERACAGDPELARLLADC